jgi:hypothetical protein
MDNDLLELIDRLNNPVNAPRVTWEDASSLSGGEMFRANFGDAVIEISEREKAEHDPNEEEPRFWPSFRLEILDNRGFTVELIEQAEWEKHFGLLSKLFHTARSSARRTREVVSNLIQRLAK